jgi:RNA polymerase sigma-70 factor, ECF subfamily
MSIGIIQLPENSDLQNRRLHESELIKRCQAGDTEAFSQLVTMHRDRVFKVVYGIVRNEHDTWDLSQEVFLKCWQKIPDFEGRSLFSTWLRTLASNVALQFLRKRPHLDVELTDLLACPGFGPDQNCQFKETREMIQIALERLSPNHRAVIVLKELEDLSYHEIAAALNLSVGTVMSRLFHARRRLRCILRWLL